MQDSRINSTLKIGIKMRQLEGETNFTAPPLKTSRVFGGIAGVVPTDVGDGTDDAGGHLPNTTNKTREMAELQDMYRRTLAASWSCGADELPPDKLIEDLFAGGDGGAMKPPPPISKPRFSFGPQQGGGSPKPEEENGGDSANGSETDMKRMPRNRFLTPDAARQRQDTGRGDNREGSNGWRSTPRSGTTEGGSPNMSNVSGRESIEQQIHHRDNRKGQRRLGEVTEFDVREDLRSWEIRAR